MKKRLTFILKFILLPIVIFSQPLSDGITQYVDKQNEIITKEFENFFGVSIYEISFETGDLIEYGCSEKELGIYNWNLNIATISNEDKFISYSLNDINEKELRKIINCNNTVRGTMIHELAHCYTNQLIDSLNIRSNSDFGSIFIKEGIAEYCSMQMGEIIINDIYIPKTIENLYDTALIYDVKYNYSYFFVKNILDKYGLTNGIIKMFKKSPPSDDEILNPMKYYIRIEF